MFAEKYSDDKVQRFFKYVINAARELEHPPKVAENKEYKHQYRETDLRLADMSEERKDELNTKIDMYYTKNYYLPFEKRLKSLRLQFHSMKRSKNHTKTKLNKIQSKRVNATKY